MQMGGQFSASTQQLRSGQTSAAYVRSNAVPVSQLAAAQAADQRKSGWLRVSLRAAGRIKMAKHDCCSEDT